MTLETLAAVVVVCATALVGLRMVLGTKRAIDYSLLSQRHERMSAELQRLIDDIDKRLTHLSNRLQR